MIYVDGNAVVGNNFYQGTTQRTGLVSLTPGLHTIDIEYYNGGGGAAMFARWDPTGGTNFVDIPNSAFVIPGTNGVIKNGSGALTLANTNTYLGSTTINAGTLIMTANGATGPANAGGVFVNTGGALAFSGGVNDTTAEPVAINGSGPAGNGAIENISGNNTFAAPITLQGNATIGSDAGTLSLTNPVLNLVSSNLTTTGAGNTVISSALGYIDTAYVGFTASTGTASSVQKILNWTYTSGATNINYGSGFASNNLSLNGGPSVVGTALELTDGNNSEARTAWTPTTVSAGTYATTFEWTYGSSPQANGFTFAVQNVSPTVIGGNGTSLGYSGIPGASMAVEFNLYNNVSTFGVGLNGAISLPINLTSSGINFHTHSSDTFKATVTNNGLGTLTVSIWDVTLNNSPTPNYSGTFTVPSVTIPSNSLTVNGTGTVTLSAVNTYTGNTTVNAGKLLVDGQIVNPTITVNSGGTLGGHGSVASTSVNSGAFLSPGDSPGILTVKSLTMASGSTLTEELGGATVGTQYDQTVVQSGGTLNLGNATLSISLVNGFAPTYGEQFIIISNQTGSSIIGTFSQGNTYISNGYAFSISYTGGAGHDVVLTVTAVPIAVTGVIPNSGPVGGGTSVIITGTGFTAATQVWFGSVAATSFTVNSATQITATDPAGTSTVNVTVANVAGTSPTSSSDLFTYNAATNTTLTSNPVGPITQGTSITFTATITGSPNVGSVSFFYDYGQADQFQIGGAVNVERRSGHVGRHHRVARGR